MTSQNIVSFWDECESELKNYTQKFNDQMNSDGFNVKYVIVDKNPFGIGYGLEMTYKELNLQEADILVPSMNIPAEIVNNIKYLLRNIQQ